MLTRKLAWTPAAGWNFERRRSACRSGVYFGSRQKFRPPRLVEILRKLFPGAHLLGCSSASQIAGAEIVEDGIVGVSLTFKSVAFAPAPSPSPGSAIHTAAAQSLAFSLPMPISRGVLVLSDGLTVNGSELTRGISQARFAPPSRSAEAWRRTGRISRKPWSVSTAALKRAGSPRSAFTASAAHLSTGSAGGWSAFGPRRRISKSDGNILYGLDDKPALDLYERYLGPEEAEALPSSALLFPLNVFDPDHPEHSASCAPSSRSTAKIAA